MNKPMILYCNPQQTPLANYFIPDLESVCCLCKTEDELLIVVNHLITNPDVFLSELKCKDTSSFIKKYILHTRNCAYNVCSFLNSLRKEI